MSIHKYQLFFNTRNLLAPQNERKYQLFFKTRVLPAPQNERTTPLIVEF
jgi:hypothetical protein